jgi:hypothetical protein
VGFDWHRRYILVQLLIMFQYLQTSVKFKTDKQVSQVVRGMGGQVGSASACYGSTLVSNPDIPQKS